MAHHLRRNFGAAPVQFIGNEMNPFNVISSADIEFSGDLLVLPFYKVCNQSYLRSVII